MSIVSTESTSVRNTTCYTFRLHASTTSFLVELNPRTSAGSLAQPLSALAHGNLLRPENGQDRICGVLGIYGAGKKATTPLSQVDC